MLFARSAAYALITVPLSNAGSLWSPGNHGGGVAVPRIASVFRVVFDSAGGIGKRY